MDMLTRAASQPGLLLGLQSQLVQGLVQAQRGWAGMMAPLTPAGIFRCQSRPRAAHDCTGRWSQQIRPPAERCAGASAPPSAFWPRLDTQLPLQRQPQHRGQAFMPHG